MRLDHQSSCSLKCPTQRLSKQAAVWMITSSYRFGYWFSLIVILSKRFLRSEGSGRAARSVAFFATPQSRVWLASLSSCTTTFAAAARLGLHQLEFQLAQLFQAAGDLIARLEPHLLV